MARLLLSIAAASGYPVRHSRLRALPWLSLLLLSTLARPADAQQTDCLRSDTPPVAVCFTDPQDAAQAAELLQLASGVWTILVEEMGFPSPWRSDGQGGVEPGAILTLTDLGEAGGYAEPVADVPQTPRADCAVQLLVNSQLPASYLPGVLCHEYVHAVELAADCVEQAREFYAPYLELLCGERAGLGTVDEQLADGGAFMFETFQSNPYAALDYSSFSQSMQLYHFGHGLFAMFLDERYGEGDGTLLGRLALASEQKGTVELGGGGPTLATGTNRPDLYEAIEALLAEEQESGFWEAVQEFALWRIFTGTRADDTHLAHGGALPGIAIQREHGSEELPLLDQEPAHQPMETGTVYLGLTLDPQAPPAADEQLAFTLDSAAGEQWQVAALLFDAEQVLLRTQVEQYSGTGTLLLDELEQVGSLLFVVTSLGDRQHDLDRTESALHPFSYSLRLLVEPTVTTVRPAEVECGAAGIELVLEGRGLVPGSTVGLGDGLSVTELASNVPGTRLVGRLEVAATAPVGSRTLTVTTPDGLVTSLPAALSVVAAAAPELLAVTPSTGRAGESLVLELRGHRFAPGATVALSGGGVVVERIDVPSSESLLATVTLAQDAATGPRDVTVTDSAGRAATLTGAFTVLAPGGEGEGEGEGATSEEPDGESGCAVAGAGSGGGSGALALLLAGLLLARRGSGDRRRRARTGR